MHLTRRTPTDHDEHTPTDQDDSLTNLREMISLRCIGHVDQPLSMLFVQTVLDGRHVGAGVRVASVLLAEHQRRFPFRSIHQQSVILFVREKLLLLQLLKNAWYPRTIVGFRLLFHLRARTHQSNGVDLKRRVHTVSKHTNTHAKTQLACVRVRG
jgi:hypothetical protein